MGMLSKAAADLFICLFSTSKSICLIKNPSQTMNVAANFVEMTNEGVEYYYI